MNGLSSWNHCNVYASRVGGNATVASRGDNTCTDNSGALPVSTLAAGGASAADNAALLEGRTELPDRGTPWGLTRKPAKLQAVDDNMREGTTIPSTLRCMYD